MILGGYFNKRPVGGVYPLDFAAPRPVVPSLLRDDEVRWPWPSNRLCREARQPNWMHHTILCGQNFDVLRPLLQKPPWEWLLQEIAVLVDIVCRVNFSSFDGVVNASDGIFDKFARCNAI